MLTGLRPLKPTAAWRGCRAPLIGRPGLGLPELTPIVKDSPVTTTACSRAERKNSSRAPRDLRTSPHIKLSFSLAKQKMQSKTDLIKTMLARGDWLNALRLASRFHDRSD